MDKEIIIDGVDVAGCFNLDEWKHCNICQELIKTIPNRHQCLIEEELRCEFYTNCYYKQLKRLEQDNEELKAYKDVNEDFKTAWEELKAENEALIEGLGVAIKYINKYHQTLQEIKNI